MTTSAKSPANKTAPVKKAGRAVAPPEQTPEEIYDANWQVYDRLRSEVEFTLKHFLGHKQIKVHSVTSRLKARQSYVDKAKREDLMEGGKSKETHDLAGIRVVCLFLSDLERVGEVLRTEFNIISEANKISEAAEDVFGYMSVHYVAQLKPSMAGPRYDDLRGLRFEVQVRTILMDAWANVSHYLDYKGEASIPSELRRDFYALSGLFYVADRQFETFARESGKSARRAISIVATGERDLELNLNTVEALIRLRYPDRKRAPRELFAVLVDELTHTGYTTLAEVDRDLLKGMSAAETRDSAANDGRGRYFSDIGMARVSIRAANPDYGQVMRERRAASRADAGPANQEPSAPAKKRAKKASAARAKKTASTD